LIAVVWKGGELMMDKKILIEEVIKMLKPAITKVLNQIPIEYREDFKQDLYLKIIKKVMDEDINKLPGLFEIVN
jgi:adenylyl- and sulfurtransferase ThiI